MSDWVSVGLLLRVFPADVVDGVIAAAGRTEVRNRALPARVVAYFSIGMALHSEGSYEDVVEQLTDGLSWSSGWAQTWSRPSKSAIFQARARLGFDPVRALFHRVARPLAGPDTPGSWLAGRRLVAIYGTVLDLPDTPVNAGFFGRPASGRGEKSAFPQARVVALAECGTHAILDAEVGPCRTSEVAMARELVGRLQPGMLALADRGSYGFHLWKQAAGTGADLLWRVKTNLRPRYLETLDDGSWLARIVPTSGANRQATEPLLVRVIDDTIDDARANPEQYRLVTTILDPAVASAVDLAAVYGQRWEIENTFDELETHQRCPGPCCVPSPRTCATGDLGAPLLPLRDPHPDGRNCRPCRARSGPGLLRRSPAHRPPIDRPRRFPPRHPERALAAWHQAIRRLAQRLNPARRHRSNPRAVKRKTLKWAAKREHHRHWPQPLHDPQIQLQTLN